jgi:hypothetical protein
MPEPNGHLKFAAYLTNQIIALKAENAELRDVLHEALMILRIYYEANSDGSTPTITRIERILDEKSQDRSAD